MKKSLRIKLIQFFRATIGCTTSLKKAAALFFIIFFVAGQLSAQDLKPEARRQMDFLINEKASRTPAQKKIDSRILLFYKMQTDRSIKANLPDLKFDDVTVSSGKVKVDMTVAVNAKVLSALKALGCEIIFSSEKFANVVANIPLNKMEQIAAMEAVKNIQLWIKPMINNGRPVNQSDVADTIVKPDFNSRANNVKNFINDVTGHSGNNTFMTNALPGTGAGLVISEAVTTHKVDIVQAKYGIKGAGIKIGVLSDGVAGYPTSQASGDLPPVIHILPGQTGTGSEGRAMMELIHDIAPDAELYYATAFISQASFAQNILDLRAAGCDIIVDDVTYYGEGVFQDDNVSKAVNTVTASGALYFSSAANSGNKNDGTSGVWEGDFVDGGPAPAPIGSANGNVHDFGGVLYNTLTLDNGAISLKWSDPLGQSANDYDLYVVNSTGTSILASSTTTQNGTQNPYEFIGANVAVGSRIYIVKSSGASARALHLNTNRGMLAISTSGVIYGHNAAASAYSVAATPVSYPYAGSPQGPFPGTFNSSNQVETFSSDGPRRMFYNPDGSAITPGNILFATNGGVLLQKPDITAADGCATNTTGFSPFYGTSAAAPNAAAIAALIKSAVPGITPAQINSALTSTAIDIETPGIDRDAGAGIIMAPDALIAAGFSPSAPAFIINNTTVSEGSFSNSNGAVEPGETGSLVINLQNYGAAANGVQAIITTTTPGVTITQNTSALGNINYNFVADNNASPFVFGLNPSVACGSIIDFAVSVTYAGSTTPTILTFTFQPGKKPAAITATLGGAPATGPEFVSSSGLQGGRLSRTGVVSTCAALKATPGIFNFISLEYHAYVFTNTSSVSQCVDVKMVSDATKFHLAYNKDGFIPNGITANYLADPGTSGSISAFSFDAPAGQNFTIVVHNVSGGTVNPYTLNVGLLGCSTPPPCTPIEIAAPTALTGKAGTPYSQAFTATGGSGAYLFTSTGTLPGGLSISGNTLSGTPNEAGSFSITINAADAAGCTLSSVTYQLDIEATNFITIWKTDNPGTSGSSSITIPTIGTGYNYDVDWNNDGTFDDIGVTGNITHDYIVAGTYQVAIRGDFPRIYFNYSGDRQKILSVDQWGSTAWTSMNSAFYGCTNLNGNATDVPNLNGVTDMTQMFSGASVFNGNISNWNVSNVTNMSYMFNSASAFNQNIGNWHVDNVTDMRVMFGLASAFNQDLGNWNVGNVTNMLYMFYYAAAFDKNIGNWNVGNVTNMQLMFYEARAFNQNISNWTVGNVSDMSYMFTNAVAFNQNIGNWHVGNVTNMQGMFLGATAFNQDINDWNVGNVTNMSYMLAYASAFDQNLSAWKIDHMGNMENMFDAPATQGISCLNFGLTLIGWADYANTPSGITLGADNRKLPVSVSQGAKQYLITTKGWTFTGTDGGKCRPLPVAILEFSAKANEDHTVTLNWATASESNNDHFTIERSKDGVLFEGIKNIPSLGNINNRQDYTTIDTDPLNGYSYYRLRQTDKDGEFTFSQIEKVYFGDQLLSVTVSPNPTSGIVQLKIEGTINKKWNYSVIDIYGEVLAKGIITDNTTLINLRNKAQGTYILHLMNEGKMVRTFKIVKAN